MATGPHDQALGLYAVYRDYLKHEDGLVNNRVGWFIQLHSFLIASYVIILSALIASFAPEGQFLVDPHRVRLAGFMVLVALAAIGIGSSVAAYQSIRGAVIAIEALRERWRQVRDVVPGCEHLPDLAGGGSEVAVRRGLWLHSLLPLGITGLWLFSLAIPIMLYFMTR